MGDIYGNTKIGALDKSDRQPKIYVRIDGKKISGSYHILSQATTAGADVQIDKTFDDDILVTSFGQKLIPMQLGGITIPKDALCSNSGLSGGSNLSLAAFYKKYNAGSKQNKGKVPVISVSFDGVIFEGILIGLQQSPYTLSDGAALDLYQYTLIIQGNFS